MDRRLSILSLAIMASGALAAHKMRPTKFMTDLLPKLDLEVAFPKSFASWRLDTSVPVVLPSPDVQAMLDVVYNQVLSRTYVNQERQRIMLSVAYGGDQSDGTKIHRPENCYPGQGFSITANRIDAIALPNYRLPTRRLVAIMPPRVEPISYWMMVGEKATLSSMENKLAQLELGIKGYVPDGLLMRVSSIAREVEAEYRVHDQFVADLYAAIQEPVRRRVFGR